MMADGKMTGGCYCGALRYEADGEPMFKVQCHCRECQYITGGMPNVTMGMAEGGFRYTKGTPQTFKRTDLDKPVTREFCGTCGAPMLSRAPNAPGAVLIKVGSLDAPAQFETPQAVIFTCDKQPFHQVPEGVPSFDKAPG